MTYYNLADIKEQLLEIVESDPGRIADCYYYKDSEATDEAPEPICVMGHWLQKQNLQHYVISWMPGEPPFYTHESSLTIDALFDYIQRESQNQIRFSTDAKEFARAMQSSQDNGADWTTAYQAAEAVVNDFNRLRCMHVLGDANAS